MIAAAMPAVAPPPRRVERSHRSLPSLARFRRAGPYLPSQQAANGALDIFVQGYREQNPRLMLFGLSVLRSATAPQVAAATGEMERRGTAAAGEIAEMFSA
jgi:hypothetical protein